MVIIIIEPKPIRLLSRSSFAAADNAIAVGVDEEFDLRPWREPQDLAFTGAGAEADIVAPTTGGEVDVGRTGGGRSPSPGCPASPRSAARS